MNCALEKFEAWHFFHDFGHFQASFPTHVVRSAQMHLTAVRLNWNGLKHDAKKVPYPHSTAAHFNFYFHFFQLVHTANFTFPTCTTLIMQLQISLRRTEVSLIIYGKIPFPHNNNNNSNNNNNKILGNNRKTITTAAWTTRTTTTKMDQDLQTLMAENGDKAIG